MSSMKGQVDEINNKLSAHDKQILALSYKMIDLEVKSRKNNVIIYGFEEGRDNVYEDVNQFFTRWLKINTDDLCIESAERLGSVRRGRNYNTQSKRSILVTFRYTRMIDTIMRNARNLAGTRYAVDRDYPIEVRTDERSYGQYTKIIEQTKTIELVCDILPH
ncbi:hypothetical protein ACF0H5_014390 [Mactra antiquata]